MEANNAEVDLFISIHRNSFPTDNVVSGVESLVYDLSGLKLEIAESINRELETIGFVNLGVNARPNLVVLRRTQMPAVLVEVGFINSDTDNQLLDENFNAVAQAIASGIIDTLQMNGLLNNNGNINGQMPSPAPNIMPMQPGSRPPMQPIPRPPVQPDTRPPMQPIPRSPMQPDTRPPMQSDNRPPISSSTRPPMSSGTRPPMSSGTRPPVPSFRVQVGAFRNPMYANRLLDELRQQDFPAEIYEENGFFLVQVGNYRTLEEAVDMERRLRRSGYQTIILRYPRPR